eukprot:scaffold8923_cov67-Phaeocystis_antarctica.AAC.14
MVVVEAAMVAAAAASSAAVAKATVAKAATATVAVGASATAGDAMEAATSCGVVIGPFTAAAVVVVHGTIALGGGADWAVLSLALLLTLLGLILAFFFLALVARTSADDGLDRARAALSLLRAARRREGAHIGLRALAGAGEVGGVGVRALLARQRRTGTFGAVRAGLAGDARLLAPIGLVLACRALDARGHARVWRDRAGTALRVVERAS